MEICEVYGGMLVYDMCYVGMVIGIECKVEGYKYSLNFTSNLWGFDLIWVLMCLLIDLSTLIRI
jgi:hypothetical protein